MAKLIGRPLVGEEWDLALRALISFPILKDCVSGSAAYRGKDSDFAQHAARETLPTRMDVLNWIIMRFSWQTTRSE